MREGKRLGRFQIRAWLGLWVGLLFAIGLLLSSNTVSADEPTPTPMPQEPTQWSTTSVDKAIAPHESARLSRQNPKLGSSLNQLLEVRRQKGLAGAQDFAEKRGMVLKDDSIQVEISAPQEKMGDLIAAVEAAGGTYQGHYQSLLQAMVPIDALESLAQWPEVQVIRDPIRPVLLEPALAGTVNTEGLGPANASGWHSAGYTGAGVRVAIIDAGFTNYTSRLGSDLPASVITHDWTGTGMSGTVHGTACAEVVYDMAPGATMYLHKVGTTVELSQAVNRAIADGVDIISMSLGWTLDGPGDGTGTLATIVANARANGILFVTAAGNEAEVSWHGQYVNHPSASGTHRWPHGGNINCFGPGTPNNVCYIIPAGSPIRVGLHWDDWTAVNQDYDLILVRWTGSAWSLVAGSYNDQAGSYPTPEEFIGIYAPYTAPYGVVVTRYSATRNVCFRLVAPKMGHLDEWVTQRSLTFPADAPNAMTVAAVNVSSPYSLESYSSRGPTFGSGGTCSGGSINPDIAGYANVSTVSYGSGGFNGTSAATPHVAGAAALVLNANLSYSVNQLQSYLENNAVDLGASGKDNLYGAGRLRLGNSSPQVNSITPNSGANNGVISITNLAGANFQAGATVRLTRAGQANINATNIVVVNATKITCNFNLTGAANGLWNVVVTNPDGQSGTLSNGFTVTLPPPQVNSITPNSGANNGVISITNLAGANFQAGATVRLTRAGQANINATNIVVVNATKITCNFNLTGAVNEPWNVMVTNPDGQSGTLSNGFEVVPGPITGNHFIYLPIILK